MATLNSSSQRPFVSVVIIGAGLSGIGMACKLKQQSNCTDYVIYDRAALMGGTWQTNTYPGCAVDVPAVLYSYSFAPNPWFGSLFPGQQEVLSYINSVADKYHIAEHIVKCTEWKGAMWQEKSQTWIVKLKDLTTGEEFEQESRILISAVGGLTNPNPCGIPGQEKFQGKITHTARWEPTQLENKNVAIIGNGASATQLLPAVADKARSTTQFIRSPHYYVPRPRRVRIPALLQHLFYLVPPLLHLFRWLLFLYIESSFLQTRQGLVGDKAREMAAQRSKEYIKSTAPKDYWHMLMPSYVYGCKRVVFDNDYMWSLQRENVHLTNDRVAEFRSNSVRTESGAEYPADVIVLATGFSTSQFDIDLRGRDNEPASAHWDKFGRKEAFKTVAMHGFPNFFYLLGPNSGSVYTSLLFSIENHVELIQQLIDPILRGHEKSVEPHAQSENQWNEELKKGFDSSIFKTSCKSWLIDEKTGQNWAVYPWSSFTMWYCTHWETKKDWVYKGRVGSGKEANRPTWRMNYRMSMADMITSQGCLFLFMWMCVVMAYLVSPLEREIK